MAHDASWRVVGHTTLQAWTPHHDHLLAEAKVLAARSHRTLGAIVEDGLRRVLDGDGDRPPSNEPYRLPRFVTDRPGLRPGVDLYDKEQMAEILGDNEPPFRVR